MAASMKRLFKAAVTLAAAALVQKGIQRAGKDQRVRRKVADLQKTVRDQVPVARKKAGEASGKAAGSLATWPPTTALAPIASARATAIA